MERHLLIASEVAMYSRPLSKQIDSERITLAIDEAERLDVMPTITDTFFLDILEHSRDLDDEEEADYKLLLEGGTWYDKCGDVHIMAGLKKCIAYYVYARLIRIADCNLTRYGFVSKTDDYSDKIEETEKHKMVTDNRLVADNYLNEIVAFLNTYKGGCCFPKYRIKKYGRTKFRIIGE